MKIGLGTLPFGLDYCISNLQRITRVIEVKDIPTLAWKSGNGCPVSIGTFSEKKPERF